MFSPELINTALRNSHVELFELCFALAMKTSAIRDFPTSDFNIFYSEYLLDFIVYKWKVSQNIMKMKSI